METENRLSTKTRDSISSVNERADEDDSELREVTNRGGPIGVLNEMSGAAQPE